MRNHIEIVMNRLNNHGKSYRVRTNPDDFDWIVLVERPTSQSDYVGVSKRADEFVTVHATDTDGELSISPETVGGFEETFQSFTELF